MLVDAHSSRRNIADISSLRRVIILVVGNNFNHFDSRETIVRLFCVTLHFGG